MLESLINNFARISAVHLNVLSLLGLILFAGTAGGKIFQRLKIPQVVGYIVAGIIFGQSGFKIIDKATIDALVPFNYFALGLIGFMIGGELKKDVFKRYGKQFTVILLAEGLAAFFFVFLFIGLVGSIFIKSGIYYWALGLLLGAIASATAPAATTDVLWEYKTRGPLTSTILGIVAMDDGLALVLFALASSIAPIMLGSHPSHIYVSLLDPLYEIGFAIFLGVLLGFLLIQILRKYAERDKILVFSLSTVLFALGLSLAININMLLTAMTLGVVLVNWEPRLSKDVFNLTSGFATPFYILFFVLVGAKFDLHYMTLGVVLIAVVYLIGRSSGKMLGANLGAKSCGASKAVAKYLPLCLFSQAGVAIGLSIISSHIFPEPIASSIVLIITLTTFVVQIIGPPSVKYAVVKAGEVGLNITEEDFIYKTRIKEVMDKNPPLLHENTPLERILELFSETNNFYYPVVDSEKRLTGIVSIDNLRNAVRDPDLKGFILAADLKEPVKITVSSDETLSKAKEMLNKYNLEYIPIVSQADKLEGFLEIRMLERLIEKKILELQRQADALISAT
ncbi:MAG: cation:proton antiporter [Candidatus Omnitrophica bacterium]|nr:cation:proton antiporter [Candidatus Omnitrophota bacterium]